MLLRKTPLSKRLTADEIESKLKDVVSKNKVLYSEFIKYLLLINKFITIFNFLATCVKICAK